MLRGKHVTKLYKINNQVLHILINADFEVNQGDFIFLAGFSGAGKTTFLKLISAEEKPDHGQIIFKQVNITSLKPSSLLKYRQNIGVIYQDYHLIEHKTVEDNIKFVLEALGKHKKEVDEITNTVLDTVGLYDKRNIYPEQLSGGEKRRITIARALAIDPILILADEPTGDLDPYNTDLIMQILQKIASEGTGIIMATHNLYVLEKYNASSYWFIHKGNLHTNIDLHRIKQIYKNQESDSFENTIKLDKLPNKLQEKVQHIHPLILQNIQYLTPKIFNQYYGLSQKELKILLDALT